MQNSVLFFMNNYKDCDSIKTWIMLHEQYWARKSSKGEVVATHNSCAYLVLIITLALDHVMGKKQLPWDTVWKTPGLL